MDKVYVREEKIVYFLTRNKMREYKIYRSDLGFGIYKKKEENGLMQIWFLDGKGKWCLNKDYARTFFHREDAVSALTIMRMKDGKEAA